MTPTHPDILAALTAGIQSEVASYVFYLEAAKRGVPEDVKGILEDLAYEEKDHFHILERQFDSLVRSEKWISTADILKQEGLPEIEESMQAKHQDLIGEIDKDDSITNILAIALRLEEQARDLFAGAIDRCDSDEGKEMFRRLSKFEQGHVEKIKKMQVKYAV